MSKGTPQNRAPRPVLLSTTEAAERLGLTDVVLRQWIRAGQLPAYRIVAAVLLHRLNNDDESIAALWETTDPALYPELVAGAIQHAHYFLERACELAGFDPAEFMRAAVLELADVDGGGRR